jgi:hypothetical protein
MQCDKWLTGRHRTVLSTTVVKDLMNQTKISSNMSTQRLFAPSPSQRGRNRGVWGFGDKLKHFSNFIPKIYAVDETKT